MYLTLIYPQIPVKTQYNMAQKGYGIAMRGQSRLYSTMYPSLYRVEGKKVNYRECEGKFALKIQAAIIETEYKARNYITPVLTIFKMA